MAVIPRELRRYMTPEGKIPFTEWFLSLRDVNAQAKITARLERDELGNLGDCRSVGDGVFELRLDYGPRYRVYFGQVKTTIVLLLCGGDKKTQTQDILTAKRYWEDYENRDNSDKC